MFDNWPEEWKEEAVSKAEILRLIYQVGGKTECHRGNPKILQDGDAEDDAKYNVSY